MQALPKDRAKTFVTATNNEIKRTGKRDDPAAEVAVAALARHLYFYALHLGVKRRREERAARGNEATRGSPLPQYAAILTGLQVLSRSLKVNGLAPPKDRDVDNFCTHKVRESLCPGFYLLVALYVLKLEEEGEFDHVYYDPLIPASKRQLPSSISMFLARRLNSEAEQASKPLPFSDLAPHRPAPDYPTATIRFVVKKERSEEANRFLEDYRLARDGHAHFVLYRGRRSEPTDLIKSFLSIKPYSQEDVEHGNRRQYSLHIYQAGAVSLMRTRLHRAQSGHRGARPQFMTDCHSARAAERRSL